MNPLDVVAPAFVEMAHRIVWCSVATVDSKRRPRSRVLHPIWQWDGSNLVGWILTGPTPVKKANLEVSPYMSLNYWDATQDTCTAECNVSWVLGDAERTEMWDFFKNTPAPVGYDPAIIPQWENPTSDNFAVLKLDPWRLRVFPGSVLMGQGGEVLNWRRLAAA